MFLQLPKKPSHMQRDVKLPTPLVRKKKLKKVAICICKLIPKVNTVSMSEGIFFFLKRKGELKYYTVYEQLAGSLMEKFQIEDSVKN